MVGLSGQLRENALSMYFACAPAYLAFFPRECFTPLGPHTLSFRLNFVNRFRLLWSHSRHRSLLLMRLLHVDEGPSLHTQPLATPLHRARTGSLVVIRAAIPTPRA